MEVFVYLTKRNIFRQKKQILEVIIHYLCSPKNVKKFIITKILYL